MTRCTCPPSWRTWAERCVWCHAQMARNEAKTEAFITALRLAYPDEEGGVDFDAIMHEKRRRDAQARAAEDTAEARTSEAAGQLRLFGETNHPWGGTP
jgi:hypothetical protein